jgi:hypothetical protein
MVEGWSLATTLFIYWFQSITIGFFTVVRILTLSTGDIHAPSPGQWRMSAGGTGGTESWLLTLIKGGAATFFTVH